MAMYEIQAVDDTQPTPVVLSQMYDLDNAITEARVAAEELRNFNLKATVRNTDTGKVVYTAVFDHAKAQVRERRYNEARELSA